MKRLVVMVIAGCILVSVPASAGPPPEKSANLRHEVAVLKKKVGRLEGRVRALTNENRGLKASLAVVVSENERLRRAVARFAACQVTTPNGNTPPGEKPSKTWHGNGALWISLWASVIAPRPELIRSDGSVELKFGWWRGIPGTLTIEGRRLDGPGPPLGASVPTGYEPTGFQPSGITFPSEGCWEITGRVGDSALSVVVLVITA